MEPNFPSFDSPLETTISGTTNIEFRGGSVVHPSAPNAPVLVGADPIMLGRDIACQLVLDDPHVSAVHAEMVATDKGVRLRDLGSRNGTFLAGVRLGEVYLTTRTLFSGWANAAGF